MNNEEMLKEAKRLYKIATPDQKYVLETLFPKLKEIEDEKIRKALIRFHKSTIDVDGIKGEDIIAWLEKQGEQKTADKVEPKFKVGDTMRTLQEANGGYTDGMPVVVSIDNEYYHCTNELIAIKDQDDYEFPPINVKQKPSDKVEPKFKVGDWVVRGDTIAQIKDFISSRFLNDDKIHLWTIQDAKDGDILACGDKVTDCPFIFHNLTEKLNPRSYCGVNTLCDFQENDENGGSWCDSEEVRPATKEQRDFLFSKMHEAGYEWDSNKKKLKKIKEEKASFANRQLYNRAILAILSYYVEKYPDIRFGQMLYSLGIKPYFDEESKETYLNLCKTINEQNHE